MTASPSELAAKAINTAQGWRKEERRCEYSTVGGEAVRTPQGWVHHGPLTPITEVIPKEGPAIHYNSQGLPQFPEHALHLHTQQSLGSS